MADWSWGHMEDGTHTLRPLQLNAPFYYIRPVYEPAIGVEWEVWVADPHYRRVSQWSSFREAVEEVNKHYGKVDTN